jgi:hypothetical protein
MKNIILSAITTVSLSTVAFSLVSESASAAGLVGSFQLSSGASTTLTLSKDSIDFVNFNNININRVFVTPDSNPVIGGSFLSNGFDRASVKDIPLLPSNNPIPNFLDLGKQSIAASITDTLNVFNLESVSAFTFSGSAGLVNIGFDVHGTFVSDTGDATEGHGNFTFQYVGFLPNGQKVTPTNIQTYINSGKKLSDIRFSGAAFAIGEPDDQKTPEPSAMLGLLGLTSFGLVNLRQKRALKK